jgi:hypothetical protein
MNQSNWRVCALVLAGAWITCPQRLESEQVQSGAQGPKSTARAQQHNTDRVPAKPKIPFGISAVNSVDALRVGRLFDTSNASLNAYANPNTSGVTFRTSRADVEPKDGEFNYSKLDTVSGNPVGRLM